jgi:hypothetical protein
MAPLDYLNDALFECSPKDTDVAAFVDSMTIIGSHDAVEEFLAYGIWPLSNSCGFEVETKETPLSRVIVPMPKVTLAIGAKEIESVFETWIVMPLICWLASIMLWNTMTIPGFGMAGLTTPLS